MNADRKEEFIKSLNYSESSEKIVKRLFKKIQEVESVYNKDIAEMSLEELVQCVGKICGVKTNTVAKAVGHIRAYAAWCINNGFPANKDILTFKNYNDVRAYEFSKSMVCSPLDLKQKLNQIYYPPEYKTTHCVSRTYFWLLFMGLLPEECIKIQTTDVNLEAREIVFSGIHYKIYIESVEDFKVCCNETELIAKVRLSLSRFKDKKRKRLEGSTQLLRLGDVATVKKMELKACRTYKENYVGEGNYCNLTSKRTLESGMYYRAYVKEVSGNFNVCNFLASDIEKNMPIGGVKPSAPITDRVEEFKKEYNFWKQVFNLE